MKTILRLVLTLSMSLYTVVSMADMAVSIDQAVKDCKAAGNTFPNHLQPIQSELKKQTSLIGMAYMTYIYQNDIKNQHYCE